MIRNLLIIALTLLSQYINAQDTASVSWELSVTSTTSAIASGGVNGIDQSASDQYIIRDYGGMETAQRVYSEGSGLGYWPDENIENLERYCEFTIFPRNGITFQLSHVKMRIGNSGGSNNLRASIYYSTNNFETSSKIASALELPSKDLIDVEINMSDSGISAEFGSEIKVRVYPWMVGGVSSGKYFNIRDVHLIGVTTGEIIPELPEVESIEILKISTQTATFKGKVTNDGGVALDSLGLVLNSLGSPNISDTILLADPMVGPYEINLENLTHGQTYYLKAFAINGAGISYGNELSFTTLSHLSVPGVNTTNVSSLRPNGTVAMGNVFFDGGLDVTLNGFCYNTQVSPTTSNNVVEAGEGLGEYSAYLAGLESETTYYLRAFAINNEGTGYGDQIEFTTPAPSPEINIVVDKNGNGDYTTIQDAFDAAPSNYLGPVKIFVKKGIYEEKVLLSKEKINVHLLGEDRDSTIIRWDDYSGKVVDGVTLGTSTSYTVAIDADDFIAQSITFQNTYNGAQAVALRVKGDRMIFQECRMLGFQDTYYTWGRGRVYNQDCYIEGTVDFIFGASVAVFNKCTINSLRNSPITAASTEQNYQFGYVFMDCNIRASGSSGVTLGRPWKPYAQTVYLNCEETGKIADAGWSTWSGTTNHLTCYYAEYDCYGEGYKPESRASWTHQLSNDEASAYTIENIFAKKTASPAYYYDWVPEFEPVIISIKQNIAKEHQVSDVYPNPVSSFMTINYQMNTSDNVYFEIYTIDGRLINNLIKGIQLAGKHTIDLAVENLNKGTYILKTTVGEQNNSQIFVVE